MRALLLTILLSFTLGGQAQPVVVAETIANGFDQPTDITGAGDGSDRLFVVQKTGLIRIIDLSDNTVLATPFLDLSDQILTNSERGVLGLTFHPDFATNGEFFVNYISDGTGIPSSGQTVISRFTLTSPSANVALVSSEEVIMTITQPFSNHNAGDLAFGPDGYLYVPTGDGGSGGDPEDNGQDPLSLLGKMLRIDVDTPPAPGGLNYVVPADNPFVGDASVRDEIWALGLRNPWRISFDRQTGDLWIGDVGQNAREEIDFQPAASSGGENYGWDCREGFIAYSGNSSNLCTASTTYVDPIFDYSHNPTNGGFSVTGGFVYRGQRANDLLGWYVCGDFDRSRLFLLPPAGSQSDLITQDIALSNITTFGEDDDANLYVAEFGGRISHITTQRTLPVELLHWSAATEGKNVRLSWATAQEEQTASFSLERSVDGIRFIGIAEIPAAGNSSVRVDYAFTDENAPLGTLHYRLHQVDRDGAEESFPVRRVYVNDGAGNGPTLSPNPVITDLIVQVPELQESGSISFRLFSSDGRQVFTRHSLRDGGPQRLELVLPNLPAGIYRAVISYDGQTFTRNLTVR